MRLRQPGHDLRRIPLVAQQVIVDVEIECRRRDVLFDVRVHGIEGVPGDDKFGTFLHSFALGYGVQSRQARCCQTAKASTTQKCPPDHTGPASP